ncbi:hypothetical protein CJ030_MR8G017924 [Morella rubra]|uniref:Uncharacterized protein n=1 Tax=Morella rubra TaxID=262757 RepID=A0A6A1UVB1_9ROSI|nr:hypothetical protein CJ030_MR8G017924 [Morella rubra]
MAALREMGNHPKRYIIGPPKRPESMATVAVGKRGRRVKRKWGDRRGGWCRQVKETFKKVTAIVV